MSPVDLTPNAVKRILSGEKANFVVHVTAVKAIVAGGRYHSINFSPLSGFHFILLSAIYQTFIGAPTRYRLLLSDGVESIAGMLAAPLCPLVANEQLEVVRSKVAELQAKLDELTIQFNAAEKDRLEAQEIAEKGRLKLELANRLTAALGSEEDRWKEGIQSFTQQREMLVGDCLLASAFISYIGPFTKDIRVDLINNVLTPLLTMPKVGKSIPMTENVDPIEVIVSEAEIAVFQTEGLPSDKVSAENAAIVLSSVRYPLLIDPQLQAITWVKKKEEKTLKLGRLGQSNLIKELLRAIEDGVPFLIENMGESIDPSLMPIISRMSIKRGSKKFIQIGDAEVEINPAFRLYLHTKLNNPHYPPEIHPIYNHYLYPCYHRYQH